MKNNIKKTNIAILFFLPLFACNKQVHKDEKSYVKYVDPFIGTSGHGHTYPGVTVPFGMLQVSPDNGISEWEKTQIKVGVSNKILII